MDNQKLAKEVITTKGGIAKSADFVAADMRSANVVKLVDSRSSFYVKNET